MLKNRVFVAYVLILASTLALIVPLSAGFRLDDNRELEISTSLSAADGQNILGDTISINDGSLSFYVVDVSLPGNSNLPVQFGRRLSDRTNYNAGALGNWRFDVPQITGYAGTCQDPWKFSKSKGTEYLGTYSNTSNGSEDSFWESLFDNEDDDFDEDDYFDEDEEVEGDYIEDTREYDVYRVKSHNVQIMDTNSQPQTYYVNGTIRAPIPSQAKYTVNAPEHNSYPAYANFVTESGWILYCGTGSHYTIAIAPNGNKYHFNVNGGIDTGNEAVGDYILTQAVYASKVEDVNGNWVKYEYNSIHYTPGPKKLTRIHSNDGREILISYNTQGLVSTVTANGRLWRYEYSSASTLESQPNLHQYYALTRVTLPDGTYWSIGKARSLARTNLTEDCRDLENLIVKHPNGVTGVYKFKIVTNGMTNVNQPLSFDGQNLAHYFATQCGDGNYAEESPHLIDPRISLSIGVTEKTLSGPGMSNARWSYDYEEDFGAWESESTNLLDTKKRTVIDPTGNYTVSHVNRHSESGLMGNIQRIDTYSKGVKAPVQTIERNYVNNNGTFFGSTPAIFVQGNSKASGKYTYLTKEVIYRDGDSFTTDYKYNTDINSPSFSYGRPVQTKVYSNVSTAPRITDISYEHNKSKWVLGLPKIVTQNDRQLSTYAYDGLGRKISETEYGQVIATYGYHTNSSYKGAPYWSQDVLNRRTYTLDWKRGTPQQIKRADNLSVYQYVDNNGWVMSAKDARGNVTSSTRDKMGRITLVNPPGSWADTTISYSLGGSGGNIQTVTKGSSRQTTTYDALLRPVLNRTQDLSTGWSSYEKTVYDGLGQVTFTSFPSSSANITSGIKNPSPGTRTSYDGLGRPNATVETVAPYVMTSTSYYRSHRKRVTDGMGKYTDYYSYGYDGPNSNNYRAIYNPSENRYTSMTQNIWGQMTQLRQWGTKSGVAMDKHHYYSYDAQQRLCSYYVPEAGATKYFYNAAGEMTAYAKGESNSGCAVPNNNSKVSMSYDTLGRLKVTNFTDPNTPDYYRTYDNDGNLKSVNRNGVNWSYSYDNMNHLTAETLNIDGRTYGLSYSYNNNEHLTRRTLPSGRQINYTLDGLGRVTSVKNWSANLVSGIQYHVSGQVTAMSYGNGQVFSQTLTPRLQPLRLRSYKLGSTALDLTYAYDNLGLISTITDAADIGNNRSFAYDGLGQLISATGSWGSGSFTYDSLGNLRSKKLGSRTVNLSYNPASNLLTQSADSGSTGTRAVSYDARGNVTTLGGLNFTYDYTDQPVAVSGTANGVGAANGSYTYDGNLKRVKAVVNNKTIYNVFDASGSLVYIDNLGTTAKTDYIPGPNGVLARIDNNVVTYLHNDHLGSAVSATTISGGIKWRERFTPFGITLKDPAENRDKAGYTGHIKDSATELNYMQARYYDPVIGRFLSIDPVGFTASNPMMFNRYAYANNNPYKYIDPDGRECTNASDGTTTCATDDYNVTFDTPKDFPGTDSQADNYHYYNEKGESPLNANETRDWVKSKPTPGKPSPASADGTRNDATPIIGGISPIEISPVTSYVTENEVSGNEVVVNVTAPGHPLHPGIVVRDTVANPNGTSTINNFGEGNGWLQKDKWYTPDKTINGVWGGQVPDEK